MISKPFIITVNRALIGRKLESLATFRTSRNTSLDALLIRRFLPFALTPLPIHLILKRLLQRQISGLSGVHGPLTTLHFRPKTVDNLWITGYFLWIKFVDNFVRSVDNFSDSHGRMGSTDRNKHSQNIL